MFGTSEVYKSANIQIASGRPDCPWELFFVYAKSPFAYVVLGAVSNWNVV